MNIEILVWNTPSAEEIEQFEYLVIKLIDGKFWYYGADSDYEKCKQIVYSLGNAFIAPNPMYKEN